MTTDELVKAVEERQSSSISLPALLQEVKVDPERAVEIIESTEKLEMSVVENSGKIYQEVSFVDDQEASRER